jgi:DNA-binding response OmpR family regulator
MKLLLVLGSDESYDLISLYVKPLGFELIRYHHVLKAMDNVEEIDPSAIIISARDFPRHWKILVQFVRSQRSKEDCPIIILKREDFPLEESSKAFFLGVSGIITEALDVPEEIDRLQGILSRYIPVEEKRKTRRYHTGPWRRFGLFIVNPVDGAVISGEVKTISTAGLSFLPANPAMTRDLSLHMALPECSLRAGDTILSPVCRLVRTGRIISLEFASFPDGEQKTLEDYLEALPLQEAKGRQHIQELTDRL